MKSPRRIIAADWSKDAAKCRMVRAERTASGGYQVLGTEPVGDVTTLFDRVKNDVENHEAVLIGFDFPIGLPLAYARQLGFRSFQEALPQLGAGPFADFYNITGQPALTRPFYPPPARQKGLYSRQALADALNVRHFNELLRHCDHATPTRPQAGCMFFTLGGQQPGPGMMVSWRDMLAPALGQILLWPFDGELDKLLQQPGIIVSEVYPAEGYRQLAIAPQRRWSKRNPQDRKECGERLLARIGPNNRIALSAQAQKQLQAGCATEDDFDALVALVFMIEVVQGHIACPVPPSPAIRSVEGWILGQAIPAPQ